MTRRIQNLILTKGECPVIDLRATYAADRYRVKKDECGDQLIPHRWGHFYSHSSTELACFMKGNYKFRKIKAQFPSIRVTQRGDEEVIFVFDSALLPQLAATLKASRKRRVSEAERERLKLLSQIHSPFRRESLRSCEEPSAAFPLVKMRSSLLDR